MPALAVVGPATARAVRAAGFDVALEAPRRDAVGLATALAGHLPRGARVLVPQADDARPELTQGLTAAGLRPYPVVAYRKRLPPGARKRARALFDSTPLGWVIFTSPRIVHHFIQVLGNDWPRRRPELRAAAIGETTAAALRVLGVTPAVAAEPTPEALVAAVADSIGVQ